MAEYSKHGWHKVLFPDEMTAHQAIHTVAMDGEHIFDSKYNKLLNSVTYYSTPEMAARLTGKTKNENMVSPHVTSTGAISVKMTRHFHFRSRLANCVKFIFLCISYYWEHFFGQSVNGLSVFCQSDRLLVQADFYPEPLWPNCSPEPEHLDKLCIRQPRAGRFNGGVCARQIWESMM